MQQLPDALAPLAQYHQFILYKLVPGRLKTDKLPVNPHTLAVMAKGSDWQNNPSYWTDAATALHLAAGCGPDYGVGFFLTEHDPFWFLDIDHCLRSDGTGWNDIALGLLGMLPGAAAEVSSSGDGLHVFGTGAVPEHACRNTALGLEFYTSRRFVALTGTNAIGSAATDCTAALPGLVAAYFAPGAAGNGPGRWTTEPVAEWAGPEDDGELLTKALASRSAAATFGHAGNSFAALFAGDADTLGAAYPHEHNDYDASSADAALAQHLAFWTGKNCERILRLMQLSGLARDKWDRDDYLPRTILNAVRLQGDVYCSERPAADDTLAAEYGAPKLKAASVKQRDYGANIRAQKLIDCAGNESTLRALCASQGPAASAKFWIDNAGCTPAELAAMAEPTDTVTRPFDRLDAEPELVSGYQYLGATLQLEYFRGCVYVQALHRIFTPKGALLKSEQFNAVYGGYVFQLDETGDKTTRKAWDAFTESQIIRYPKAESTCFRPELPSGSLIEEEGQVLVNTYVPIETPRQVGDPAPFLRHLQKLLPNERDRQILLAYMAACVQHKGVKFQWAPLLQGTEGNGKTLFTRCVAYAIGNRYTHLPPANEISEKFNDWLFNKLFIGIEDVYVPDHKREVIEVLKPMITNDRLAMRAMQQSQVMGDNRANFILNSNHKDGVRKTVSDRRFSVFFTAQQQSADLTRDGMDGAYFPELYEWLRGGGYAIVADFLAEYDIPDELNPATQCHRAPVTSSTGEAIEAGMGGVEQEILEAIDEGRPGFAGGWISSVALESLLQSAKATRAIPPNKRRELLQSLGYDWHPALTRGRANNPIPFDGGKKSRLFIRNGHLAANLTSPVEVARAYQDAQERPSTAHAEQIFNGDRR